MWKCIVLGMLNAFSTFSGTVYCSLVWEWENWSAFIREQTNLNELSESLLYLSHNVRLNSVIPCRHFGSNWSKWQPGQETRGSVYPAYDFGAIYIVLFWAWVLHALSTAVLTVLLSGCNGWQTQEKYQHKAVVSREPHTVQFSTCSYVKWLVKCKWVLIIAVPMKLCITMYICEDVLLLCTNSACLLSMSIMSKKLFPY